MPWLSRRSTLGLSCLLAAGALGWWCLRPSTLPAELAAASPSSEPAAAPSPAAPPQAETVSVSYSPEAVPLRAAAPAVVNTAGMQPHAITPQHERIFRENNLIGNLNGAMDVRDAAGLRRLVQQYRDEYPEDAHVLQAGYELIADCLERPGAETRAVAQRYYDEQLDSGLRRYIRRHCLEASN